MQLPQCVGPSILGGPRWALGAGGPAGGEERLPAAPPARGGPGSGSASHTSHVLFAINAL